MSLHLRTSLELAIEPSLIANKTNLLQDQTIKRGHLRWNKNSNSSDLWLEWKWKTEEMWAEGVELALEIIASVGWVKQARDPNSTGRGICVHTFEAKALWILIFTGKINKWPYLKHLPFQKCVSIFVTSRTVQDFEWMIPVSILLFKFCQLHCSVSCIIAVM